MPKETNKKQSKDKKHFIKDFKAELKRVIWPTPKQLLNNTIVVISIVLLTVIIVFILDFAFEKMNELGIEKIKTVVESNKSNELNTVEQNQENSSNETQNSQSNNVSENAVNE